MLTLFTALLTACNGGHTDTEPHDTNINTDTDTDTDIDTDTDTDTSTVTDADGDGVDDADDCRPQDATAWQEMDYYVDGDRDSYGAGSLLSDCFGSVLTAGYVTNNADCDDIDRAINPGATEVCDGEDNNCDGMVDESAAADASTWYADVDDDGFGSTSSPQVACEQPLGYVADNTDCDDTSASAHDYQSFYVDSDGDGVGSSTAASVCAASAPVGYSSTTGDCDDTNFDIYRSATINADADGDSYTSGSVSECIGSSAPAGYSLTASSSTDCNDASSSVYPGATETCNSVDDDCDGTTDEGVTTTYYADADSDTYGNATSTSAACSVPVGYVSNSTDCDDTTSSKYRTATVYADADSDTYTSTSSSQCIGSAAPAGYSLTASATTDCNDAASSVYPGATETCNSVDDDCDGATDEGVTTTYYADSDGDSYGNLSSTSAACSVPVGYVSNSTDCDDTTSSKYRTATIYADTDSDSYTSTSSSSCIGSSAPAGYSLTASATTDCNDAASSVYPGATETCNSVDDDCDGTTDEGVTTTYYADADSDTYGNATSTTTACTASAGYVSDSTDCDDGDATTNPGETENTTTIGDENCDGQGIGNLSESDNFFDGIRYDYMGFSMANVGDMTGDGLPDTLVGAPGWTGSAAYGYGYAFLIPGNATTGWDTSAYNYIEGETSGDGAGDSVELAGDLDGDGTNDIVVGASYRSSGRGSAYLVSGATMPSDVSLASADYEWVGDGGTYDWGASLVLPAGDFNGDGNPDLLLGAYRNDDGAYDAGQAYLEFGPITSGGSENMSAADVVFTGSSTQAYLGLNGAAADFDGDGLTDLAISAPNVSHSSPGKVYIFRGDTAPAASMTPTDADSTLTSSSNNFELGSALFASDTADIDSDGLPDLVLGERYNNCNGSYSGAIYIDNAPLTSKTMTSASAYAYICGEYSSELGDSSYAIDVADQDGDGEQDLLLGAQRAGRTYLYKGPVSGVMDAETDANQIIERETTTGYNAGRSAKFLGDMDGDGYLEIGVGDPDNSASGGNSGTAYLIFGDRLQ